MADDLQIFGSTFSNVVGIKASNTGGTVLTFLNSAEFLPLSGGTLTGQLITNYTSTDDTLYAIKAQRNASGTSKAGIAISVENSSSGVSTLLAIGSGGKNHGLHSSGYWDGTTYTSNANWIIHRNEDGNVQIPLPVAGTLVLSNTTDASGTAAKAVALIVGGTQSQSHIEIDGNEILCKSNATTPSTLYLQDSTGTVEVAGSGGLTVSATTASSSTTTGALRVSGGVGIAGKLYTGGNVNVTGTITASSTITTGGHSSAIGTIKTASLTSAKNCSTATDTMICSISLEAGTWVITGSGRFPANATGYRHINISTTSADNGVHVQTPAVNGAVTQLTTTFVQAITSTTTFYLNGYQNSGSTLSLPAGSGGLINGIRAVRIA